MSEKIVTKIAGVFKYPAGKPVMKALKHGDGLILESEPTNAYDPNAVKVLGRPKPEAAPLLTNDQAPPESAPVDLRPVHLGYVPAPIAMRIKNRAVLSCIKSGPNWDEITIEIE